MTAGTTSVVNELARERNRLAADRTLLSWLQSCLKLIAFGFAFNRISAAIQATRLDLFTTLADRVAEAVGAGMIVVGIVLLAFAIVVYRRELRVLDGEAREATRLLVDLLLPAMVVAFGLAATVALAIKAR